jgi:transketolase
MNRIDALAAIAQRLRIHSLRMTTRAGSGHPTTCLSMAEIAASLFFSEMRFDPADPDQWGNDEFILSKGHAAPILWAAMAEAGIIPEAELQNLRRVDSDLEGHPTPRMRWIKAATGSLGQGLAVGAGMAAAMKLGKSPGRVFVVMGDGECAEGSVWEAAGAASHFRLKNLCAIVDVNGLGQSEATMHGHDAAAFARKFKAFGWETVVVDGHKVEALLGAFARLGKTGKPTAILAKTLKGKGVSFLAGKDGWHGKPLKADELAAALAEIGAPPSVDAAKLVRKPKTAVRPATGTTFEFPRTAYADKMATRMAYGNALKSLGAVNADVVALDGDVKNSTFEDRFFEAFPKRSFQIYIAEQAMVGMAMGFAAKGYIPYLATFAAFLSRAHDQIRMAAYSLSNIKVCGSHVGVSIGEDGPSQMGLEDLAIFRAIPGCVVLYPSDAFAAEACVAEAARHRGMCYIRTSRPANSLLYPKDEAFPIGGSKVLRKSAVDQALVVAAGVTVFEALKAYETLKRDGIEVRVLDAYSVQPLDIKGLEIAAAAAGGKVIVVEDHYQGGGLGEAVAAALSGKAAVTHLCIRDLPRSGKPDELVDAYGISARHIAAAVRASV